MTAQQGNKWRLFALAVGTMLGLGLAAVVLHEAAHTAAALLAGVPFNDIKFGFYGFNPAVFLPQGTPADILKIVHYAGGLGTGAIGLAAYLFWRRVYRRRPTAPAWFLGLGVAVVTGWQIANGWVEGRAHAAYILWSGELFTLTNLVLGLGMLQGLLVHRWLNPPPRVIETEKTKQDRIGN